MEKAEGERKELKFTAGCLKKDFFMIINKGCLPFWQTDPVRTDKPHFIRRNSEFYPFELKFR